jgi:hypothetical protein
METLNLDLLNQIDEFRVESSSVKNALKNIKEELEVLRNKNIDLKNAKRRYSCGI